MARVLVLFAHPALEKSRIHRAMAEAVPQGPALTFHDLYEQYPRLDIEVAREQSLLAAHDVVVLQFPFYWYSTPPHLKQWEYLVLEHGWAYGSKGTALQGKALMCAIRTGGRQVAYQEDGYNRFTVRQLLSPNEQTARLCGMHYLPPWVVYGTHGYRSEEIESSATGYRTLLSGLRDEWSLPREDALDQLQHLNEVVDEWGRRASMADDSNSGGSRGVGQE
jgi:glutathione-regulated potassium-efflux system ancillary protein KefG